MGCVSKSLRTPELTNPSINFIAKVQVVMGLSNVKNALAWWQFGCCLRCLSARINKIYLKLTSEKTLRFRTRRNNLNWDINFDRSLKVLHSLKLMSTKIKLTLNEQKSTQVAPVAAVSKINL